MNVLRTILSVLLCLASISWAAEQNVHTELETTDPAALQEATRVLEEEIKLAAKPHTYLVINLETRVVLLKNRGITLHYVPIENWSASHLSQLESAYRLRERPPIIRRKIDPVAGAEQDPISLADMPITFTLQFSPPLTIQVLPYFDNNPWQWATQRGRTWWNRFTSWGLTLWTGEKTPASPSLSITLAPDHAQSLAWSLIEGMPLLIHRPTAP